MLISKTNY